MSKNAITIEQLNIACRHVTELMGAGMTENMAIRNLELFANLYAKVRIVGNVNPDHADQYKLWSKAARKAKAANPELGYGQYLRVEHGTPRRHFARLVFDRYRKAKLSKRWMDSLCDKRWKVAVITHDEDKRLNNGSRSRLFKSPEERWAIARIIF